MWIMFPPSFKVEIEQKKHIFEVSHVGPPDQALFIGDQHQSVRKHNLPTPKFNMEPENDGFQKESPIPGTSFQVPC